jgi:hypothetical protein
MSKDDEGVLGASPYNRNRPRRRPRPRFERVTRPRIRCSQPATGSGVIKNAGNVEDEGRRRGRPSWALLLEPAL